MDRASHDVDRTASRRYPRRPIVCVGAVICVEHAVVLIRRREPPLAGRWTLPGGVVELGETLHEAVRREAHEETGLSVAVGPLVDVVEHVSADDAGGVEYHYVILDYLCRGAGGVLTAGDDADEVRWAAMDDLESYALTPSATAVIQRAAEMYTSGRS